ncbi:MAG: NFACT family protein, partial [Spirochaetia bacterium]|nr:NFACT family protein [Spirochaetia bacterium]
MSLNYKEINRILEELDLSGSKIQKIYQPAYDTIVLELYRRGERLFFLASVASGACRIHSIPSLAMKNERPLRFMECLRSRIRNGIITEALQIGNDRIVQISIHSSGESGEETL